MYYYNPEQKQYQAPIPVRIDIVPETHKKSPRVVIIDIGGNDEEVDNRMYPPPKKREKIPTEKRPFNPEEIRLENLLN